ncbi:hypothetical protein [Streptomyces halstedii]|uniref:Uncharacterized protein n=1 Tax=Streptomyces halstedii TaxID=1944 RepID=A0A6N9U7N0_STRHA|nr:hypothetical protein [Streptomyces halstedii]NEA19841.1 hypothetical protein [Streptomyces halstedii]
MRIYLDPLAAEAVPNGTFGGARQRRDPNHVTHPTHPLEAARRRAILLAELRDRTAAKRRQNAA